MKAKLLLFFAVVLLLLGGALFLTPFWISVLDEPTNVFTDSFEEFGDKVSRNSHRHHVAFAVAAGGMALFALGSFLFIAGATAAAWDTAQEAAAEAEAEAAAAARTVQCGSCAREVSPSRRGRSAGRLPASCPGCGAPLPAAPS